MTVADAPGPYGVFGYFDSLTLISDRPFSGKRILAQDLAGTDAVDISSMVQLRGKSLYIPGNVIRQIGLQSATPGDISAPGLVIAIS